MKNERIIDWLSSLGSKTPAPGGGAVAAMNAAMAANVLKMVCEYSIGPKFAEVESEMKNHGNKLKFLSGQALEQAQADAAAFSKVSTSYKTKDKIALQSALIGACTPPIKVIEIASEILNIADKIKTQANKNVISDVGIAAISAKAAIGAAILNIEINAAAIDSPPEKDRLAEVVKSAEAMLDLADSIRINVRKAINS